MRLYCLLAFTSLVIPRQLCGGSASRLVSWSCISFCFATSCGWSGLLSWLGSRISSAGRRDHDFRRTIVASDVGNFVCYDGSFGFARNAQAVVPWYILAAS